MAKFITKGKRKRWIALTAVALSVTLSLGVLAACGGSETPSDDTEETTSTPTDTQQIKNGNFEFFSEMTEDDITKRRDLINSPTSWTLTTVSPASDTKSGIIDLKKGDIKSGWDYLAKSGRPFTGIADAYANWDNENATVYDRLKFLDEYDEEIDALTENSEERVLFDTYRSGGEEAYSIDYEDVRYLNEDFENGIALHEGAAEGETNVLMLHNYETSDGVLGTATYATSSTTITLKGGTAAKVTLWAYTDKLTHYDEPEEGKDPIEVTQDGGAYVAVTNTVGSNSSSPQFIIKNINTQGAWQQYTVYIRANTFATTTYRLVLGLGRNTSSDNRLEAVNGYAFFDDIVAEAITDTAYETATKDLHENVTADLNSSAKDRIKDATDLAENGGTGYTRTFALDLKGESNFETLAVDATTVDLTEETSGSLTVASKVGDNRGDNNTPADRKSIAEATTYASLKDRATANNANGYLKTIFENDFDGKFPFYQNDGTTVDETTGVIMLLSTNGAAYTAKLADNDTFTLAKDNYMLISFFVKTSTIRTGKTGASVTLVDGENRTSISAFDSTTVDTVDIDKDTKDIYKGWVQCFFIVKNETDGDKTFSLEFNYGPTSIVGSKVSDYADGYAAFANFQVMSLTKAQAGFASTGTYAKSVSLTEYVKDTTKFDDAAASYDIEKSLAAPANFRGVTAGTDENATADIVTGLLNREYADAYADDPKTQPLVETGGTANWWGSLFGDAKSANRVATQPLVIYNKGEAPAPAYGYLLRSNSTISANSSQRISLRLKVSAGLHAYICLYDLSNPKEGLTNSFAPTVPSVTYWYDDDGNIVKGDPTADGFNKKTDILYYLQENGLYTKAGETDGTYYANLANYKTDDKGNLVTGGTNSQIVFYRNENDNADTAFYAYREGKEGSYTYSQAVKPLPAEGDMVRYNNSASSLAGYTSIIEIAGTDKTAATWVEVCFYVRTGSEAKTYSLAIWAGNPSGETGAQNTTIPAGGSLFVDCYKNESTSNFEAIREERVSALSDTAANLADPEKEDSNLKPEFALYYTYTFYDSDRYVRYDKSQDENNVGSPWIDYAQSAYEEGIAWLKYTDLDGDGMLGTEVFIDYSVSEVEVAEHVYDTDSDTDTDEDSDAAAADNGTNIWLILSSSLLAFVLIFAIVAIIVRKLYKKHSRGKIKVVKDKPAKKRKKAAETEESAAAPKETTKDDNDPYNE